MVAFNTFALVIGIVGAFALWLAVCVAIGVVLGGADEPPVAERGPSMN